MSRYYAHELLATKAEEIRRLEKELAKVYHHAQILVDQLERRANESGNGWIRPLLETHADVLRGIKPVPRRDRHKLCQPQG